jgi:nicotinate phosphoribosyltransferase
VVKAMRDTLGTSFAGSSNTYLAYKHDLEAIGTNAHELPMALAAMAESDAELKAAQYRVLELWQNTYQRELLIMLPDTFGTTQFLDRCAGLGGGLDRAAHGQQEPVCCGRRIYRLAEEARTRSGEEAYHCLGRAGCRSDSRASCLFFGEILGWRNTAGISQCGGFSRFAKWNPKRRIRFSSGWGTLLTNDFRNCDPDGGSGFDPISLVCKLTDANGTPAVKLSDNYSKAMGHGGSRALSQGLRVGGSDQRAAIVSRTLQERAERFFPAG